jgi:hypothetical protein
MNKEDKKGLYFDQKEVEWFSKALLFAVSCHGASSIILLVIMMLMLE